MKTLRKLVASALPYGARVRLKALMERAVDARDVDRVRAITSGQWRAPSERYVESYWSEVDGGRESVATRRSRWLSELPPFARAASVLELGCGPGRNLYVLGQRHPHLALHGVDINADGIAHARRHVRGEFVVGDLYDAAAVLGDRQVDVVFTMGVLIHLHPDTLPGLITEMRRRARRFLVLVEQVSETNEVVKGPAGWRPRRRVSGDYIQWSPDLPGILRGLGLAFERADVPDELQSNGARHVLTVPLA